MGLGGAGRQASSPPPTCPSLSLGSPAVNERALHGSARQRPTEAVHDDPTALVVDLHNDHRLCLPPTRDDTDNEPIIVCTMGLWD